MNLKYKGVLQPCSGADNLGLQAPVLAADHRICNHCKLHQTSLQVKMPSLQPPRQVYVYYIACGTPGSARPE